MIYLVSSNTHGLRVEEWLGEDNQIGQDIWHQKYQHGNESLDEWLDRVSGGDDELRQLILEKKFLYGGRTLTNRNVPNSGNLFNCFSAGFVPDDYAGIMDTLKEVGITFKVQGGQGISMSKLRPKGTPIGKNYKSDGIIPFIEMFNVVTQGTSQGGARKGALMISLDARHKEAEDFIKIKTDIDAVTKANLSLEIDDHFMRCVNAYYENGETVILHEVREYSGHTIEYDVIPIELYKLMMKTVWDYGEPGCIFTNRFRNYNFLEYDDNYQIETSNPCGEQPLKKQLDCCLGSINLYEFVENKFTDKAAFDYKGFYAAIRIASKALDTVIDENAERLTGNMQVYSNNALDWRNIGLGVFGYADMLMALGLRYGSEEAIKFTDELFSTMIAYATICNVDRSKELGQYPMFDAEAIKKSEFFKMAKQCVYKKLGVSPQLFEDLFDKYGFRNCTLLSIAPTGTIATMTDGGRSGGTEPEFALSYTRRTDNLNDEYKIEASVVKDYRRITGDTSDDLPDYFVESADIPWRERVDTQAAIQKYIDTAISSTVNLPKETTVEEIEQLYLYAWQKGLKGITIFRDGCKRLGILMKGDDEPEEDDIEFLHRGDIINVSDDLVGYKRKVVNGCGDFSEQIFFDDYTGEPLENFIAMGDGGGCARNLEAISRLISLGLRGGIDIHEIVKQLKKVRTCPAYRARRIEHGDTSEGTSCPSAIGFAIESLCEKINDRIFDMDDIEAADYKSVKEYEVETIDDDEEDSDRCPECGSKLQMEGGCVICRGDETHPGCGWSRCD